MWVIEGRGYMQDLPATNERAPMGRISVLEDTNNDGRWTEDGLHGWPSPAARTEGAGPWRLIGEPPHLWLARDTNSDLKADSKELVVDTYSRELGNIGHNANGLTWALDSWIYLRHGS
jgi:hypothetical protein